MAAPLAKGLIVLAVVVVAAGAAAYENPQVRDWVENSRRKLAHSLHSLGDDVKPRAKQPRRNDRSMREDAAEAAEERRRRARTEIMEKGRIMEERQRMKQQQQQRPKDMPSPTGNFDTLVDKDGMLKRNEEHEAEAPVDKPYATTTAIDTEHAIESGLKNRRAASSPPTNTLHQSVDAPLLLHQLPSHPVQGAHDAFETQYEREMRNTWRLPLSSNTSPPAASSAHESESLINLTPTSEFPDPDIVLPRDTNTDHRTQSPFYTGYFSMASDSSHTLSEAAPDSPPVILPYHLPHQSETQSQSQSHSHRLVAALEAASSPPGSSSLASSIDHVNVSDAESSINDDDDGGVLSEFGDGIRTPASAWTDVGSVVSSDAGQ